MEQGNDMQVMPPVEERGGLSFRGLLEVFHKPAALFEELGKKPKVLVPYVVVVLVSFVFFLLVADIIVRMQMESPQFAERMQGAPPPPNIAEIMRYSTIGGGILTLALIPLLAAAFAMFWGNFVYAGKASFKQLLSVMLYGEIINALGILVVLPMVLAKGSILVSFSLGVLAASQGPESLLYLALSKIDLFIIWEIIVVGIGLSVVYNIPRNKGYVLSVLSMGMLSILHIVFTAIGKLFT